MFMRRSSSPSSERGGVLACDNQADMGASHMTAHDSAESRPDAMGSSARRRLLMWLMLSVLVALVAYFGFRGYLSPEFLFHFANGMYC